MSGLHLVAGEPRRATLPEGAVRVGAGVLGDLPRRAQRSRAPGRSVHDAWTWDLRDRVDLRWWPQGVALGTVGGRRVVLVSWYAKKVPGDRVGQGSRVTVLDLGTLRYRHVLLLTSSLEPLEVHAGGIALAGDYLHVAATGGGVRVCRLADVARVTDPGPTFGYRYVLPAWRRYESDSLRFSFLSHSVATSELIGGEHTDGGGTRRLARFPLGPDGLPLVSDGRCEASWVGEGVDTMQGAALVDGRLVVSTSHGRLRRGSLWTLAGGAWTRHRGALPNGPEDLTYDVDTASLWSVSEHPLCRWLVRLELDAT